jgi:uncharacterized protein with PQ loop repeat
VNQALAAADTVAVLSTAAKAGTVAQLRRNYRTRSAAGLSRSREVVFTAAYAAWLWHGIVAGQVPEIVSGALGGAMSLALLAQIGWYRHGASAPGCDLVGVAR